MNRIHIAFRSFKTLFLVMVLLTQGANAVAKDKDCWVDFYEGSQYAGKHVQLEGPIQLENLNNVKGENWDSRISSLKVGAKATLTLYENLNFKLASTEMAKHPDLMRSWGVTEKDIKEESELIFHPNSMVHDLSDFNFHQKVKSLQINCN
ncbi:MAG: beta/gamma crystallin domain-containing protein [Methylococcales bacterium]